MSAELTQEVYTTKEAARLCGLTPPGIRVAIRSGKLKSEGKFNGAYVILKADLEKYLSGRPNNS